MIDFNVLALFPIPIIKFRFKEHDKYFFNDIEKQVNLPKGWIVPLNSTFPNIPDDDLLVPSEVREQMILDLTKDIDEVLIQLKCPLNYYFSDFWYNIYHDNQGQETHNHLAVPGHKAIYWSGVYYNKNASPTKFYRPNKMYSTQLFPGYEDCELHDFYYSDFSPSVEDGDVLLFPPYFEHSVTSYDYHKDNMRMTFSFNLTLD